MNFCERLKELRVGAGWTQLELADRSGVPVGTIRDYEQGKRDPLLPSAQKLARALGLSLSAFDGVGEPADGTGAGPTPTKKGRAGRLPAAQEKPARRKTPRPRGG